MKKYLVYPLLMLLAGCSTGPYLHPESALGQKPIVTVTLASGERYRVTIEQLKTGFDPRAVFHSGFKGTALGKGAMDDFTLTFPHIFVNGEKVPMAPIHFKKREERYAPVFNC